MITALVANVAMGGSDRALMLGLPGVAVLAAFALPTLNRSTSSAIDWFSVFFFTLLALWVWVVYIAMQTGIPARTAAHVTKLAPGFVPHFAWLPLVVATLATVAWLWLVRWRTARHRAADRGGAQPRRVPAHPRFQPGGTLAMRMLLRIVFAPDGMGSALDASNQRRSRSLRLNIT